MRRRAVLLPGVVAAALVALGISPASSGPAVPPAPKVAITAGSAFADGIGGAATNDKLTFPPGNMTSPQVVASEPSGGSIFGYDFSPDGSILYGVDGTGSTLITVNQFTGAQNVVGPMTVSAGELWSDVVIDPRTGAGFASSYGSTSYTLYSVDLGTGAATPIKTVATSAEPIDLAINCTGDMYAETIGDDKLYRVDRATGGLTPIGPIGMDLFYAQGMDFDNATGVLHAWLFMSSGASQYSRLDLKTGAATPFPGGGPAGEFEGAIKTTCPAVSPGVDCAPLRAQVGAAQKAVAKAKAKLTKAKRTGKAVTKAKKKLKKAKKKLKAARAALAAAACT